MSSMPTALALMTQLAMHVPTLVVWAIAAGLALHRWQRHPRASLLVVLAMTVFFLETVAGVYLSTVLPMRMHERGAGVAEIGRIFAMWGAVRSLVDAGGWAMLIVALFGARGAGPGAGAVR